MYIYIYIPTNHQETCISSYQFHRGLSRMLEVNFELSVVCYEFLNCSDYDFMHDGTKQSPEDVLSFYQLECAELVRGVVESYIG